MRVSETIERRVFNFELTEEEGLILRTLLNLNGKGVEESLMIDEEYWNDLIKSKEEAIRIGCEICDTIMKLVDKD